MAELYHWLSRPARNLGMMKKTASGVLVTLPCSRTGSMLRASKWLRPCWVDFFDHSYQLLMKIRPNLSKSYL